MTLGEVFYFALTQPDFCRNDVAASGANESSPSSAYVTWLTRKCRELFTRDGECTIVDNRGGGLCATYPPEIIVPTTTRGSSPSRIGEMLAASAECKFARARCRLPVPVLAVNGKLVCRSSTLSIAPEMVGQMVAGRVRQVYTMTQSYLMPSPSPPPLTINEASCEDQSVYHVTGGDRCPTTTGMEWGTKLVNRLRRKDSELLSKLGVGRIYDLMVENKKEKFGVFVTSSEKCDDLHYARFRLNSVPYPGCEFFAEYARAGRQAAGLAFDWSQVEDRARISADCRGDPLRWIGYERWDLNELTKAYLRAMLEDLKRDDKSGGVLIHCISGWDRTPLFVSLLRLSLWADGLAHQSLSACEIVFLTVVYDWLMFSHHLKNRVDKREEVMHFCFNFLAQITGAEFSLIDEEEGEEGDSFQSVQHRPSHVERVIGDDETSSDEGWVVLDRPVFDDCFRPSPRPCTSLTQKLELRRERLLAVRDMMLTAYESALTSGNGGKSGSGGIMSTLASKSFHFITSQIASFGFMK